jgi:hypothetical protein
MSSDHRKPHLTTKRRGFFLPQCLIFTSFSVKIVVPSVNDDRGALITAYFWRMICTQPRDPIAPKEPPVSQNGKLKF